MRSIIIILEFAVILVAVMYAIYRAYIKYISLKMSNRLAYIIDLIIIITKQQYSYAERFNQNSGNSIAFVRIISTRPYT